MKTRLTWFVPAGVIFMSFICTAHGDDVLRPVLEAYANVEKGVQSGRGVGRLRTTDKQGVLVDQRDIALEFAAAKFRITLTNRVAPTAKDLFEKIVSVSDGKALFCLCYSSRFTRSECETQVFEVTSDNFHVGTYGFPWFPNTLHAAAINVPQIAKEFAIDAKLNESGDIIGSYSWSKSTKMRFIASHNAGFNVTRSEVLSMPTEKVGASYDVDWELHDRQWYVKKIVFTERDTITELGFDRFEVNPVFGDDTFTLAGLGPCSGSRIVDNRPGHAGTTYQIESSVPQKDAHLRDMTTSLQSLKSQMPAVRQESTGPSGGGNYRMWIAGNVIIVILLIAAVVLARRRAS